MTDPPRPLPQLRAELRALATAIAHYRRQARFSEEAQARTDYAGLLREVCAGLGLDPARVHHPLLGPPAQAPAGTPCVA